MNKKNLSMSSRDRNLLIILGLLVVIFICYMYIVSPAIDRAASLKSDLENLKSQITVAEANVAKLQSIRIEEINKKNQIVEKYKGFFYEINQERILYQIDTLIAASGITLSSYTPTPADTMQIIADKGVYIPLQYPLLDMAKRVNPSLTSTTNTQAQNNPPAANTGTSSEQPVTDTQTPVVADATAADAIPHTEITLAIGSSNYASVLNFISYLENMNKSIVIKSMDMIKTDTTGVQGQIIISLYSLPKLDDSDKDYLKFLPVTAIGKANIFN